MKILLRILVLCVSIVAAMEIGRLVYSSGSADETNLHYLHKTYYETADRKHIENAQEGYQAGLVIAEPTNPRQPSFRFAPNSTFYICYTGLDEDREAYFDDRGCVQCKTNSLGMREREELAGPKPEGQTRVLCIGDSFTFGWGVKVEDAWPRRVENDLRRTDDSIRTVNAGAAGAIYVDEYRIALEERFHVVDPDVVVITLCLNDLLPTIGALCHQEGPPWLFRRYRFLRDIFTLYPLQDALAIDEDRQLVDELMAKGEPWYAAQTWTKDLGRAGFWPGGGPQKELLKIRDWCAERGVTLGVSIWPYFQGLGPREHYPLRKIHELVGTFCFENEIPFVDVLPALENQVSTHKLWVSPADFHGNERAQEMATPLLSDWIGSLIAMHRNR